MTAAEALAAAAARLRAAGVDDPARDARILLAHAAKVDAARITLIAPEDLAPDIAERFDDLVSLRAIRVPVSHLIGERAFYGRRFKVSSDVLDPRPDTETVIEAALSEPFERVLDLGTGSGCILVTLLGERPDATGLGTDISEAACLQASANAVLHHVADRAQFICADWLDGVQGRFDLIVSNPPYLSEAEMSDIAPELARHEPRIALTDGKDGLSVYRLLAAQAPGALSSMGRLLVEIGWTQGAAVRAIFEAEGWAQIEVLKDIDGRDRAVQARYPQ